MENIRSLYVSQVKRTVKWRDLARMTRGDGLIECIHPLPWLLTSWWLAAQAQWFWAVPCSFMFFLTALRLNHEAIHHNLGFSATGHYGVLHVLSALMTGSNNAVAANHLDHHRHAMTRDDIEGKCGRMRWYGALAYGPCFPIEMHSHAWRNGGLAVRARMRIDAALNLTMLLLWIATDWLWLGYHLIFVATAQCFTAYFAVWITHHGCNDSPLIARTQRNWLINRLSYNMFFHLEHHMFPGVPVKRLPRLAARLDAAFPQIIRSANRVIPFDNVPKAKAVPITRTADDPRLLH
ncbi:MAG: fatty acid desaturase [Pseudomonadota bacterium]